MMRLHSATVGASWVRAAFRIGLLTSLQVPVGILVVKLIPGFWSAYPLLLLPLLLAGPLAARRLSLPRALGAAALAGLSSGTIAVAALALAWWHLGDWYWMLTSAAGAPPMPPLPRITLLPTDRLSWAHQDILFFQPILAVALGFVAWSLRPLGRVLGPSLSRLAPRSLSGRLRQAFGALILLTLVLGMVGFGMIEEMHVNTHRIQLRADWLRQLGVARVTLDQELQQHLSGGSEADQAQVATHAESIATVYQALASTAQRPGLSARPEDVANVLSGYQTALDAAVLTHQAYRDAGSADVRLLSEAITSLSRLQRLVETDLGQVLASTDQTHHRWLIAVMALVALFAALGIWTCERVLQTISAPLEVLRSHLGRVARGEFAHRVLTGGPAELRHLGESVNRMTADLARLYDVERERRAMAEALARREHELSAAKEFWTNTLVHDLKNPLTVIVGWTDVLEYDPGDALTPDQQEAVQHIRRAAGMLDDLVADVNDSFRLQAAALPIHRTSVRPGELLWTAVTEYRGLDRTAPDVRVAGGLAPVLADTRLVGRVLHNLIGNAYKHGGASARVAIVAEPADDAVRFAVDDDGPGIPLGERERVFEQFIQGSGAAHGSGLGLAFCKLVVEQLGGRIWADNSPFGGARIAFELPAAPVSSRDLESRVA